MIDPQNNIATIAGWNLKHPKPVQTLLDANTALNEAQQEAPSWEGVLDPKKVAETVQAQAQYTIATGEAATAAVRTARFKISQALVSEVAENLDTYAKQLETRFNTAAGRYEEAAEKLPEEFTSEDVVAFDTEQFTAYREACSAAAEIGAVKQWALSLVGLIPGQAFDRQTVSTDFLVLDPRTVGTYAVVQLSDNRGNDAAYSKVSPVLLKAVKAGATLRLALPDEASEDAANYEAQRQTMRDEDWRKLRASIAV